MPPFAGTTHQYSTSGVALDILDRVWVVNGTRIFEFDHGSPKSEACPRSYGWDESPEAFGGRGTARATHFAVFG